MGGETQAVIFWADVLVRVQKASEWIQETIQTDEFPPQMRRLSSEDEHLR